jgi:hypothetical protein
VGLFPIVLFQSYFVASSEGILLRSVDRHFTMAACHLGWDDWAAIKSDERMVRDPDSAGGLPRNDSQLGSAATATPWNSSEKYVVAILIS